MSTATPRLCVDCIIRYRGGIVFVERKFPPLGIALPGGFVEVGESPETAVLREVREETGLDLGNLQLFGVYGDPDRDDRFHTVSIVYQADGIGRMEAGDDAQATRVFSVEEALKKRLCFDHNLIISDYLRQETNVEKRLGGICGKFFYGMPVIAVILDRQGQVLGYNSKLSLENLGLFEEERFRKWVETTLESGHFQVEGLTLGDQVYDFHLFQIENDFLGCILVDITNESTLSDELAESYIQTELAHLEVEKKISELRAIAELSHDLLQTKTREGFYRRVIEKLSGIFPATSIGLYTRGEEKQWYQLKWAHRVVDIPEKISEERVRHISVSAGLSSEVILPIMDSREIHICLYFARSQTFKEEDIRSMSTFATTITLGFANLVLYLDLRDHSVAIEYLNSQLKASVTKLETMNKMKTEFVRTVSHELRTPLTSIKAHTQTLQQMVEADEVLDRSLVWQFLAIIEEETARLTRIITTLLDLSRIEARKLELRLEKIEINRIVERLVENYRSLADKREISMSIHLSDAPLYVNADRDRMVECLTNILSNAIKYNRDKGLVEIVTSRHGDLIKISVRDTGPGIAESDREVIFETFVRRGGQGGIEGAGLGLSITRKLVELHRGRIELESEPGKGAVFTIVLPAAEPSTKGDP